MGNLLVTQNLKKYFPIRGGLLGRKRGEVKAVDGVSIAIKKGETFGLVGESGCGKTTYGKTIIRLLQPDGGKILFDPEGRLPDNPNSSERLDKFDITNLKRGRLKALRRHMQIVYQNPSTSLNPRMLVKDIVSEPLIVHGICKGKEAEERVLDMLKHVGLSKEHMRRYPHEFSGGQRQRIAIARALITHPEFVVLDEPTSSVDVSVRAALIKLFKKLQKNMGLTYLFISHDLSVVEAICDRVAVMYLGKAVELATAKELFADPLHPYTQALFSAIPVPDPEAKRKRIILKGEPPSPANPPKGCRFHPRCPHAMDICSKQEPPFKMVHKDHYVACHLY
ncbi:ABC transporter ATP-binding protein [Candidatus Bathyarchaeota archaeon]|nr:ABC transporter ATP-binding protein [Candidatus Bathyarchaeota archaeon]